MAISTVVVDVTDAVCLFYCSQTDGLSALGWPAWTATVDYLSSTLGSVLTGLAVGPWVLLLGYLWWHSR